MGNNHDRKHVMDAQDFFAWQSQTANVEPFVGDDEASADAEEPPERRPSRPHRQPTSFQKAIVRPQTDRKESLLTRAFTQTSPTEQSKPDIRVTTDITRRRSTMSIASAASTAELTSDGGITSPARTTTPSPPYPSSAYMNFVQYQVGMKTAAPASAPIVKQDPMESTQLLAAMTEVPQPEPVVEAPPRKRCISFACGAQKAKPTPPATKISPPAPAVAEVKPETVRRPTIQFACPGPKKVEVAVPVKISVVEPASITPTAAPIEKVVLPKTTPTLALKIATPAKPTRQQSRSPSMARKLRPTPPVIKQRDSSSTVRLASRSPVAVRRTRKPNYIAADEEALKPSEATRFHEFASDEPQEDDWIRRDSSETKAKITIKDTLRKENVIRQLGEEAEEEALDEDDEDEEDEDEDEEDEEEEEDDEDDEDDEDGVETERRVQTDSFDMKFAHDDVDSSDEDASDGNETDNEAGFADSDDESDGPDSYSFWTPGRAIGNFRSVPNRTASDSSIDSLRHMSPVARMKDGERRPRPRHIRIRPGTPDLPDSTDFVCGTLDEDRPLEDAYVSCMEARKREKRHIIPQDIDPSFPTSDLENDDEEDNDDVVDGHNSETDIFIHGKFEDSDEGDRRHRPSVRRSPAHSPKRLKSPPPPAKKLHSPPPKRMHSPPPPKRLHSPPPSKAKLRSPPPTRRLFGGHSPKRVRSPPPARTITSPTASPINKSAAIGFTPLGGGGPGITHTKSLPRTPNAFCRAYRASRLIAANGNIADGSDNNDGHTRGAIDIVKGLERKRLRRTEKLYQKHCNRARKGQQVERRPLPGKGAERMRELGLMMAGKTDTSKQAEYVISV